MITEYVNTFVLIDQSPTEYTDTDIQQDKQLRDKATYCSRKAINYDSLNWVELRIKVHYLIEWLSRLNITHRINNP